MYEPVIARGNRVAGAVLVVLLAVGGLIAGAVYGRPFLGLGGGLALAGALVALFARAGDAAGTVFRVEAGVLTLRRGARGDVLFQGPLESLLNVKIHTEELAALPGGVPYPGSSQMGHAPLPGPSSTRESRIFVILRGREEPLYLTDDRFSAVETAEWLASVRRFLSARGWRPATHRAESEADA